LRIAVDCAVERTTSGWTGDGTRWEFDAPRYAALGPGRGGRPDATLRRWRGPGGPDPAGLSRWTVPGPPCEG